MNLSLVTIGFNGYGRFAPMWLALVSNMKPKPKEVIIVLGRKHGLKDVELLKDIYPKVKIIHYRKEATFGKLRNIAISHATSDWIQFLSIDDKIEPDAIKTFKRALEEQPDADYICAKWNTIGLGLPLQLHNSPLPIEMAERLKDGLKGGFVIPHSPFKRWIWEEHQYRNSDLPNYDFLLHAVLNGANFVRGDKPTTTYLRRPDSHARTTLLTIKKQANKQKRIMGEGIVKYYVYKGDI